jgi:hypothetical protein
MVRLVMKSLAIAVTIAATFLASAAVAADTKHRPPRAAGHFAGGQQHTDDAYTKAASEDRDKLLNSKLKSICRGC